jgi:hypothetical protein
VKRVAFTVLCSTILCTENASPATDSIRILFLDGQRAGAYHNWQLTKQVLKKSQKTPAVFKLRWRPPRSGGDFSNGQANFNRQKRPAHPRPRVTPAVRSRRFLQSAQHLVAATRKCGD